MGAEAGDALAIFVFRPPQVAGSLDASHDDTGLFAGIWGSSAGPGNEVDVYAGWAKTFGDFGVKAGYYKYTYPYATSTTNFDEIGLNLTFSGAFVDYYMGTGEVGSTGVDNKNNYVDFGYTMDKVTAKVGMTMNDAANTDYTHLDVTYAYNKNLSFTLSGIVDADPGATLSDLVTAADQNQDPLFVVSYTLPLDLK